MISESRYWKDELLKVARKLAGRTKQTRWSEASLVALEKDVFVSFYAIRKLIEGQKITSHLAKRMIEISCYPNTGRLVHILNRRDVHEFYDLSSKKRARVSLSFLCNQMIHSYVFLPGFNTKNRLASILFNSDYQRNKSLFQLPIRSTIQLLQAVGHDYSSAFRVVFDDKQNDYKFVDIPHNSTTRSRPLERKTSHQTRRVEL